MDLEQVMFDVADQLSASEGFVVSAYKETANKMFESIREAADPEGKRSKAKAH